MNQINIYKEEDTEVNLLMIINNDLFYQFKEQGIVSKDLWENSDFQKFWSWLTGKFEEFNKDEVKRNKKI